ncbi:MAG: 1-(5-phosphoribosyl)-5-[(5-phosphoribosylamino)methylideneamino]imidazole-4-carboxamide isomerase [Clostridiales bacterium]|nr:MAG: 1-(5-phosphoribosyl)-5-[(5-phosphoribosylamino)methylideneamino]imidazole-4-carboxamide isomerase [Clostridiales bacterium]
MKIFPAIDLYEGQAVRLYKGDYQKMTVYARNPLDLAQKFVQAGCKYLHMVDLEGAKDDNTANQATIAALVKESGLFCQAGGGIRSFEVIDKYLSLGVNRLIIGTKAVEDPQFVKESTAKYGEKIAVGIDLKDGLVAIKGWRETAAFTADEFFALMSDYEVKCIICTDISKDGTLLGPNLQLYEHLQNEYAVNLIASGGVSSIADIRALAEMKLYGAIIGKAYYEGRVDLEEAVKVGGEA